LHNGWDVRNHRPADVLGLLKAVADDFFEVISVSDKINNARYQGSDVQERVEEKPSGQMDMPVKGDQPALF